ncbi:hypothetical protein K488DRAFT_74824 [Vararia minispora EC-137]|uniref:Uncharacterized protein n=1 Tax=Vararia minispora EC-137 TaxID=1314806 RepID=A0ACB8Q5R1_9AGAM|nr:hypothetical protein K488DRAFT_74824 [Vararia minispora EC-137]
MFHLSTLILVLALTQLLADLCGPTRAVAAAIGFQTSLRGKGIALTPELRRRHQERRPREDDSTPLTDKQPMKGTNSGSGGCYIQSEDLSDWEAGKLVWPGSTETSGAGNPKRLMTRRSPPIQYPPAEQMLPGSSSRSRGLQNC